MKYNDHHEGRQWSEHHWSSGVSKYRDKGDRGDGQGYDGKGKGTGGAKVPAKPKPKIPSGGASAKVGSK